MSSTIIPSLRYQDAKYATQWLQSAFGFLPHLIVEGEGDRIDHAQFVLGSGMFMFGSGSDDGGYDDMVSNEGGSSNIGLYVIVEDVDDHCETARDAGAEIVVEPEDQDYGGRVYTCRDFEGNVWSFGDYDPWE